MKDTPVTMYAVWTNTDLTEGRGSEYVLGFCELEATANRMAKGRYVQGTDARVTKEEILIVNGRLYYPGAYHFPPSREDIAEERVLEAARVKAKAKDAAIAKAKALGLSDDEIEALR